MRYALALALALLVVTGAGVPARAEEPPAADPRAAAREHYLRGKQLQEARSYDQAIAEYEAGHALTPVPEFLFNIAQCYRLMGEKAKAVDYYRRYLEAAPAGKGASEARTHIDALAPPPPVAPAPAPVPAPLPQVTPEPRPELGRLSPREPERPSRPLGRWQVGGLAMMGAGVVAAGAGTWLEVRAGQLGDEVTRHPNPWTDEKQAKWDRGQRYENIGIAVLVGAGLLVGGGVAAYWWGPRPGEPGAPGAQVWLTPSAGLGHVGLTLDGHF